MNYPIFSAIVNQLELRLARRAILVDQFRLWTEDKINATGLEIGISLSEKSKHVKKVVINLDWDKFREAALASQLPGMEKHPLLKNDKYTKPDISPHIDVETIWYFDEEILYSKLDSAVGNRRMVAASHWMEYINRELKREMTKENLMTRWHVDIEGDINGRFVTDMSLISYLQYDLRSLNSLNAIHIHLERSLQEILLRSDTIIGIASKTIDQAA